MHMINIIEVDEMNIQEAENVYTASWRESHLHICTPDFLKNRDFAGYLRKRIGCIYMVCEDSPVGVFSLLGENFGDLYIHPEHQGKGYGKACIAFAMNKSTKLRLTVLSDNVKAIGLYEKMGFQFTGKAIPLKHGRFEREMVWKK